jgi:Ca2+-binding EF-hand superfamily protein
MAAVETTNVVIEEPSDQNETEQEKPCFTKKHLYIAIGVVFVIAISLIGSLLDFSPESNQVTEESIREGTLETFPEFDTNGDGFIDRNEFTQWSAGRIAGRRRYCTPENPEPVPTIGSSTQEGDNSTTTPTPGAVDEQFNPIDLNRDGRISRDEAVAFALRLLEALRRLFGRFATEQPLLDYKPAEDKMEAQACPVPKFPGCAGRRRNGWVGACKAGYQLWCYSSPFCRHKRKCHKSIITIEWTATDTCCGSDAAANCTSCTCGGTYRFVPPGRHARARALCHWLAEYQCGDYSTGVAVF